MREGIMKNDLIRERLDRMVMSERPRGFAIVFSALQGKRGVFWMVFFFVSAEASAEFLKGPLLHGRDSSYFLLVPSCPWDDRHRYVEDKEPQSKKCTYQWPTFIYIS